MTRLTKSGVVTRRAGRILLTSFLVVQMLLGYVGQASLVQAQLPDAINTSGSGAVGEIPTYTGRGVEESIKQYLCVPDDANLGTALYTCVTKLYRFGIAFGAIALVFFVVYAGYLYISGGEATKQKGKSVLFSSLLGMAIILSSYVLLSFINPDLVKIRPIQPPIFTAVGLPKCEDVGLGVNCVLPTGQVNYPGGSGGATGGMRQWQALITTNAQAQGIKYCALYALVELESSGVSNIVSNGPPNRVDVNHSDKKFYGLPFTRAAKGSSIRGHGIGLGQVFIYGPPGGPSNSRWADSSTPSRGGSEFGFSRPLTITDLINPDTALKAAAYHFAKVKMRNVTPGNYAQGYANYHGAATINGVNVKEIYQSKFLKCEAL